MKKAYDNKGNAIAIMQGDNSKKLPLDLYFEGITIELLDQSLKQIIQITNKKDDINYVDGFKIIEECLWPLII